MKKRFFALLLAAVLLCGCRGPEGSGGVQDGLVVHFVDVGQADCALVECGGEFLLIDGGNRNDGQLVVSYLQQQGVEELAAVVCSHAHEDHVGGLPSVLAVYPTQAVYAPTRTYASNVFDDFVYYADQQGLTIQIPTPGDVFSVGEAKVTVLGPVKSYPDPNDTSIVLRIDYGESSFLFTGDMETTAETDMLDYWEEGPLNDTLQADVLKVGHHGSYTSTGYRFLKEVNPEYAVISVGKDNSYGHPHEEPLSRLQDARAMILRTDALGHIQAVSDGKEVTFTWGNQKGQPEAVEPLGPMESQGSAQDIWEGLEVPSQERDVVEDLFPDTRYIGNRNSKKLHSTVCNSLPNPENRVYFDSYQEAVSRGYEPHRECLG